VVAVLRELKKRDKFAEIRFWCDPKFAPQARSIVGHFDKDMPVQIIVAGKLRRFQHLTAWQHITVPSVFWPNLRDIFLVVIGFIQSLVMLLFWRPDVVFAKGGFVCLPVGCAAKFLGIPLVIHDSDAHPGLTNRILAKWATRIATGAPLEHYPYPAEITQYVGVPIGKDFVPRDSAERAAIKTKLGFDSKQPLIVVTGGGLGASLINNVVAKQLNTLLDVTSVVLLCGTQQYDELRALTPQDDSRFQLHAFVSEGMADLLGSADIVITRAGATTILELAGLARPTVLIPGVNNFAGGHQLKNAAVYADTGAVEVIDEFELASNPQLLGDMVTSLLANPDQLKRMSKLFHSYAKPDAASQMANMVIDAAK
jgi:UDP-N-acetylglucosamine--N-acetylmuramyl-(pentapeptide) pyrophosphoryl-undecaprenol N-acetylglucosamine transferase